MTKNNKLLLAAMATLLAGCGAGTDIVVAVPERVVQTRVEALHSTTRGMENIVFNGGKAYLSLSSTATEGSAVLSATGHAQKGAAWTEVPLGACGLRPASDEFTPVRAPGLKVFGDTVWLYQQSQEGPPGTAEEHSLCSLGPTATAFVPRDQGLRACNEYFCSTLWMTDLKQAGGRMYTNAGGGENLFVSSNQGAKWDVISGQLDSSFGCYHQEFHVMGQRLLVGGECPMDFAYVRAYGLNAEGTQLVSSEPLPVTVPELENRKIQFIESTGGGERVFVGVEGGLLRSVDGGKSFKFVIEYKANGGSKYPYVDTILMPKDRPGVVVVGGFDKENAKPYLAWSADHGDKWTDLSHMLPGYDRGLSSEVKTARVTDLAQDPAGRILLTLNEDDETRGHLMLLTLGKP